MYCSRVRKVGSIIEKLKEMLEEYLKKTKPKYYPPVENLLDLVIDVYSIGFCHFYHLKKKSVQSTAVGMSIEGA